MREAGSPWKVSVAVDPKLIGATNVRLIANKIAGEPTASHLRLQGGGDPAGAAGDAQAGSGKRGVAGENYHWLGPDRRLYRAVVRDAGSEEQIKSSRVAVGGGRCLAPALSRGEGENHATGEEDPLCQHYLPPNTAAICG